MGAPLHAPVWSRVLLLCRDHNCSWDAEASLRYKPPGAPGTESSLHNREKGRCPWVRGGREETGREAGRERGAEMHSLAVAEDIHPVIKQNPRAQNRDQLSPVHSWAERGCCKTCWDVTELHESPGTRDEGGEQTQTRPQGWSNPTGRDRALGHQ